MKKLLIATFPTEKLFWEAADAAFIRNRVEAIMSKNGAYSQQGNQPQGLGYDIPYAYVLDTETGNPLSVISVRFPRPAVETACSYWAHVYPDQELIPQLSREDNWRGQYTCANFVTRDENDEPLDWWDVSEWVEEMQDKSTFVKPVHPDEQDQDPQVQSGLLETYTDFDFSSAQAEMAVAQTVAQDQEMFGPQPQENPDMDQNTILATHNEEGCCPCCGKKMRQIDGRRWECETLGCEVSEIIMAKKGVLPRTLKRQVVVDEETVNGRLAILDQGLLDLARKLTQTETRTKQKVDSLRHLLLAQIGSAATAGTSTFATRSSENVGT